MDKKYEPCNCGSGKTYKSFAGDVCCSPCFKPLSKVVEVKPDTEAKVINDGEGWAVKVAGITKKHFSKYEDYAHTEAMAYRNKLNAERI